MIPPTFAACHRVEKSEIRISKSETFNLFKTLEFLAFDIVPNSACLREVPPCGPKAGISCFEFTLS